VARERDILMDTGPLVAVLDAADARHRECLEQWNELGDRCLTTEAVLTEATHLLARGGADANIPLGFLLAAGIPIRSRTRRS
jgi:predicted nucleic acid-binding protein